MKYLTKRIICAAGCLLMLTSVASAHPGQTDADGGHWDNDTGEYHYHHGYPAHQHTNGICPYDYDDQTGRNSGTSGSSATDTISQDTTSDQVDDVDWRDPSWEWVPDSYESSQNFSNSGSCPQAGHIIPRQYYYDADGRMYTPYQDQAIPHADGETDNSYFMQAGSYNDPENKPKFDYFTLDEIVYMFGLQEQSLQFQQGAYFGLNEAAVWSDFNDTDSAEDHSSDYDDGYYQGYRDGFFADRSAPNSDIIDRSELGGASTRDEEEAPAVSTSKTTESGWTKYYPYIIGVLACLCILFFVLMCIASSNYQKANESLTKRYYVLRDIGQIIKNRPSKTITENEINEILRKHQ